MKKGERLQFLRSLLRRLLIASAADASLYK
jgi:hypothetical protein